MTDPGARQEELLSELGALRVRIESAISVFLDSCRAEMEWSEPQAALMVDEIARLIEAGGKRLRPAFCYWGYRAAGGADDQRIIEAAGALELLHTMALVHDDLMDGSKDRRGVEASRLALAAEATKRDLPVDPEAFGWSAATLVGDLAAVLADRMFLQAGFPATDIVRALGRYHWMRTEMAVGQYLDIAGLALEPAAARRAAGLKGGSYTVEGPLLVGASLAGGQMQALAALSRYGAMLGEAFQLSDDLHDGEGHHGATWDSVRRGAEDAVEALRDQPLDPEATAALTLMAQLIATR
jgi:geranylgeranyl diphosphate synthase, type I